MSRPPADCHPERSHVARGLCQPCYRDAWKTDSLPDLKPKPSRPPHSCDRHDEPHRRCYAICGCRCQACLDTHNEYEAERRRLMAYGQWQPYVDADAARRHVQHLVDQGMGKRTIAQAAGIRRSSLRDILNGRRARIRPETADQLLDVELVTPTLPVDDGIAAVEACRRQGMTTPQIAEASGVGLSTLYGWTYRLRDEVFRSSVEAVRALVDDQHGDVGADQPDRCVDCGGDPMPGGALRCLPCFQTFARDRKATA